MRKRIFFFIGISVMLVLNTGLTAKTKVLIDFDKLKANGNGYDPAASKDAAFNEHPEELSQHMPTLVDYRAIAGSNFTEEDKKGMGVSLAASNWDVTLNSSAKSVQTSGKSYAIEWHTKYSSVLKPTGDGTADNTEPEGYTVFGARVHFPESTFNNWALIKPPFEIPAYEDIRTDATGAEKYEDGQKVAREDKGAKFENGFGVVKNVGILKSIAMRIYGCQFKNSIAILLKDDNGVVTEYHMPQYLDFDGWREITWNNPNYIDKAANRDLYVVPLYPRSVPYVKVYGFRIYRQGDQLGGDFITYIKDVVVTYDEAVLERENLPIDHEDAWGILQARTEAAKKREISQIGNAQILRFLEKVKMDKAK